jgi:hypothetical protein
MPKKIGNKKGKECAVNVAFVQFVVYSGTILFGYKIDLSYFLLEKNLKITGLELTFLTRGVDGFSYFLLIFSYKMF